MGLRSWFKNVLNKNVKKETQRKQLQYTINIFWHFSAQKECILISGKLIINFTWTWIQKRYIQFYFFNEILKPNQVRFIYVYSTLINFSEDKINLTNYKYHLIYFDFFTWHNKFLIFYRARHKIKYTIWFESTIHDRRICSYSNFTWCLNSTSFTDAANSCSTERNVSRSLLKVQ